MCIYVSAILGETYCFCPWYLSVHLFVCPYVINLHPLVNTSISVGTSKYLGTKITMLGQCAECMSRWPWLKVKVTPWAQRSYSSILYPLKNTSTPGGTFKLLCTKYLPCWDDVQSLWVIDLGSSWRSHHGLRGHITSFCADSVTLQCLKGLSTKCLPHWDDVQTSLVMTLAECQDHSTAQFVAMCYPWHNIWGWGEAYVLHQNNRLVCILFD